MAAPRYVLYTIDVHVRYTYDGNQCENVFQYAYPEGTTPTLSQLILLSQAVRDSIVVAMRNVMPNTALFREIYVRDIHAATGRQQYTLDISSLTGSRGGSGEAGNVAANVISRTGFTGRNNHGAKRLSPFSEGDVDKNELQTALMTLLINFAAQWLAVRTVGGVSMAPAVASALTHSRRAMVSAVMNNNFIDSQKTRLTGHGA